MTNCPAKKDEAVKRLTLGILLAFSFLIGAVWCETSDAHALAKQEWKIERAFQDSRGGLLVQFQSDPQLFPTENRYFFGTAKSLQQLDAQVRFSKKNPSSVYFGVGTISFEEAQATVSCEDGDTVWARLNEQGLARLGKNIETGKTRMKLLPEVQEPDFFLQVKDTDEFVYVTSPRFNFHENYEVHMGHLGRWKKIKTVATPQETSWNSAGMIHFQGGGGIYVPVAIDLFASSSRHRGSAILIRSLGSRSEQLVRPALNPKVVRAAGVRVPAEIPLATPCD
jgi:hypothetical protein